MLSDGLVNTTREPGCFPKISIIIPSYNQGRFLEQTLRSVVGQDYPNLEIIVLDGGSNDDSVAILQRYASHLTYWRSSKDGGQAAAIGEGLRIATGDICAYLNSDDLLAKGALRVVADIFSSNQRVDWIIGDVCLINEQTHPFRYLREPYLSKQWQIFVRNCIPQSSVFWRRAFYEEHAQIDTDLHVCLDSDLFFQFWKSSEPVMVRRLLSYQRQHGRTKTSTLRHVWAVEYPRVLERHFGARDRGSVIARLLWRCHRAAVKFSRLYYFHALLVGLPRARRDLSFLDVAG